MAKTYGKRRPLSSTRKLRYRKKGGNSVASKKPLSIDDLEKIFVHVKLPPRRIGRWINYIVSRNFSQAEMFYISTKIKNISESPADNRRKRTDMYRVIFNFDVYNDGNTSGESRTDSDS